MISQRLIRRSLAISPCSIYRGCRLLWPPQRFWKPHNISIRSLNTTRVLCEQKGKDAAAKSGPTAAEQNGSKPKNKKPDVLAQASLSTTEQRKADWAIMKEMAKYLWPKVSCKKAQVLHKG